MTLHINEPGHGSANLALYENQRLVCDDDEDTIWGCECVTHEITFNDIPYGYPIDETIGNLLLSHGVPLEYIHTLTVRQDYFNSMLFWVEESDHRPIFSFLFL